MIRLTCTQCKATLEMDDAFAGGVCRCQHCGAIQTVPSHLKANADAVSASAGPASKTLYQSHPAAGPASLGATGLDDLADVVASSGLSGSGLTSRRGGRMAATAPATVDPVSPTNRSKLPMLIGAGAALLVLIGVGGYFAFRKPSAPGTTDTSHPSAGTAASGPNFCGVAVTATRVIYVFDRGNSNERLFDALKHSLYKSIESLGPKRQFQIIFWTQPGETNFTDLAFPTDGPVAATPENLAQAEKKFEDLTTSGTTELDSALQLAVGQKPDIIVLATAKGFSLDDATVATVDKARASSQVKIIAIDLSGGGGKSILKTIAEKSGGQYVEVTADDLNRD